MVWRGAERCEAVRTAEAALPAWAAGVWRGGAAGVEAVGEGVAGGVEVRGGADGRGVVAEVGDEGLDELRAVAGVVADDGLQGLPVEGFELLRVLLQDAEEELVGAGALERRGGRGALYAVADLQGDLGLGVGVREQGRGRPVAGGAHGG